MEPRERRLERRLAAIFAADVEGYSRLMGADEVGTLRTLTSHREIMDRLIGEHGGRIANTAGDSVLAEFPSVVDAVQAAVEVQEALRTANEALPEVRRVRFRIGVHVGDVMVKGGDLFGEGVNIAARLQAIPEPNGVCISGAAYDYVRKALPLIYEDLGFQDVKNIAEPVRAFTVRSGGEAVSPAAQSARDHRRSFPVPDKPSIAVLPFVNIGSDPEDDFLAVGTVEDITAALSRVRSFFVIARNSTFTYKGGSLNVQQVSRELGVRYVLEGSVRRSRDRVRISAQLIDAATGAHIWADHYDGLLEGIFDLQDRITASVVGAIQPSIRAAEIERARRKRPDSLSAYDLVMRALPYVWSLDRASNETATRLLDEALSLDTTYPLTMSLSAWCSGQRVVYNWSSDPESEKQTTIEKAQAAADLAEDDPFVLTVLAAALTMTKQYSAALLMIEKALALDPNSAWAWNRSGWLKVYTDLSEEGIDHFERAIRLSPFDPMIFNSYVGIGGAHYVAGRYETAITWYEKACLANPKAVWINRILAPAYVFAGRQKEAEAAVRKLLSAYPDLTVGAVCSAQVFSERVLDLLSEGLRKAGLPE
jgi:adenylate cyclase